VGRLKAIHRKADTLAFFFLGVFFSARRSGFFANLSRDAGFAWGSFREADIRIRPQMPAGTFGLAGVGVLYAAKDAIQTSRIGRDFFFPFAAWTALAAERNGLVNRSDSMAFHCRENRIVRGLAENDDPFERRPNQESGIRWVREVGFCERQLVFADKNLYSTVR